VTGPRHRIYAIRFATGQTYIGQTTQTVRERLINHRGKHFRTGNPLLKACLQVEREPLCETLAETECPDEANRLEWEHLQAVPVRMRLNRQNPPFAGQSPTERIRAGRLYPCAWCRRRYPADCFHRDASRSSGLASKCKECKNLYGRYKAKYGAAAGYAKAKAERCKRRGKR